ncbi:unnamed protein product, partial [marine sediment metagenome]
TKSVPKEFLKIPKGHKAHSVVKSHPKYAPSRPGWRR